MWAALAILVIIISTAGHQYLKSTLVKSFLMLVFVLLACVVSFTYFEKLTTVALGYGYGGQWAQPVIFILLFLLTFAIFVAISEKLIIQNLILGDQIDLAGRVVFGIIIGFVLSGVVLITVAMMPIPTKWPYERFEVPTENSRLDLATPKKAILNPDGFVAGLYSWISQGSLSSKKSFAVFHPDYIDQVHLNRYKKADSKIINIAGKESIQVKAAWVPETELTVVSPNEPFAEKAGTRSIIVRAGIKNAEIKDGGAMSEDGTVSFAFSQIRLMYKTKDQANNLTGSAKPTHPSGYIKTANMVEQKALTAEISPLRSDFSRGVKWFDFVFNVPTTAVPVLLEFKQNSVAKVPPLVTGDKIPEQL